MIYTLIFLFSILFLRQLLIVLASRYRIFDVILIIATFLYERFLARIGIPISYPRVEKINEMKERLRNYIKEYEKERKLKKARKAEKDKIKQEKFFKKLNAIYDSEPENIKKSIRNKVESKLLDVVLDYNLETGEQKLKFANLIAEIEDPEERELVNFNVYNKSIDKILENVAIPIKIKEQAKTERKQAIERFENNEIKEFPLFDVKNYLLHFAHLNRFKQIVLILDNLEKDFHKFYGKDVKAAGTRIRKGMQELKKLADEIKREIQSMDNSDKK